MSRIFNAVGAGPRLARQGNVETCQDFVGAALAAARRGVLRDET